METNLVDLKIARPDGDAAGEAMTALTYAESFAITTSSDSVKAQEARARLNTRIKALTDARMTLTRPIDASKKVIMDFFAGPLTTLERAKRLFDQKIIAYDDEQELIRLEAQRKAEAEAAKERRRLQEIADAAQRKAEAEAAEKRRLAEEAAGAGRAEEAAKLQAQAARVEERAADKAEDFNSRAAAVVAPIIQSEAVKAQGTSLRENWVFEITDASKINPQFLMPDEVKIGKLVKSMKADAAALIGPGVRVFAEKILASRRA